MSIKPVATVAKSPVVAQIARRLFQIAHQSPTLDDLGQYIARLLAGQVHAAKLRHRIVAELDKDLLIEIIRASESDCRVDGGVTSQLQVTDELVEKESAQTFRGTRVTSKESALDDLG